MKSNLHIELRSHRTQPNQASGFTLIELMVVIISISVLAAIALPAFLNQSKKAQQSEAKNYVGALIRGQQTYHLENSAFASNLAELNWPIASRTENYQYTVAVANQGAIDASVTIHGESLKAPLKPYVGGVFLGVVTQSGEATTTTILCENQVATKGTAAAPIAPANTGDRPTCANTTKPLK